MHECGCSCLICLQLSTLVAGLGTCLLQHTVAVATLFDRGLVSAARVADEDEGIQAQVNPYTYIYRYIHIYMYIS